MDKFIMYDLYITDEEERSTLFKSSKKKKQTYKHKYKSEWEANPEFRNWIQPSTRGNTYFKCKICVKDYIDGIVALRKHMSSRKHQNNLTDVISQPTVTQTFNTEPKNAIKENEIRLAAFIAEHNISICVIDHLVCSPNIGTTAMKISDPPKSMEEFLQANTSLKYIMEMEAMSPRGIMDYIECRNIGDCSSGRNKKWMKYLEKPEVEVELPEDFCDKKEIATTAEELYRNKSKFIHSMYKFGQKVSMADGSLTSK